MCPGCALPFDSPSHGILGATQSPLEGCLYWRLEIVQRYIYFIKLFGSILLALSLWTNTRYDNNLQLAMAFGWFIQHHGQIFLALQQFQCIFAPNFYFYFHCCQEKLLLSPCRRTTGCSHQDWLVFQLPVVIYKLPFLLLWAACNVSCAFLVSFILF